MSPHVEDGPGGGPSLERRPPETIAVVIPTALTAGSGGTPLVASCLASLLPAAESPSERATDGLPHIREVILLTQGRALDDPVLARLAAAGVAVHQHDVLGPFNFSRKVNAGARLATSDVLFLLNDDVVVRGGDWPAIFLGALADVSVGVVGPVIVNPDGTLNAAGDTYSADAIRHVDAWDVRFCRGLSEAVRRDRDVSLLTAAAFLVSASDFRLVGGFDEAYPSSFGDSDFCLRLGRTGRRLVCTPRVTVVHAESSSRDARVPRETLDLFRSAHPETRGDDPLLPPLALPWQARIARSVLRPLRGAYRRTIRPLVPRRLHLRLWHAAVSRGWVR
jgi:hypothetical protein